MRIGIDVGGTNTDAVLMNGNEVLAKIKTPTTADVTTGITTALKFLLNASKVDGTEITGVMIGTTHFTNAVVERRRLVQVAAVRVGLPATACLPPMVDWPADLRESLGNHKFLVHGGNEFDGRKIAELQPEELRGVAREIATRRVKAVAITAVFAPVSQEMETAAAAIIREVLPDADITLSHEIGRMGLLERENATILNACLRELARKTVSAFQKALTDLAIKAPLFISQNDGTLMSADFCAKYPVLTFSSGPTNSMRGAAFLSGLKEAIVVDIGGTTTDVGVLTHGFPREASVAVEIGGVRTNFRMPDVLSVGLGGGSLVQVDPLKVGPQSVGYELTQKALVFGGDTLTTSDMAVAAGIAEIGDRSRVAHLPRELVQAAMDRIHEIVETAVDRMKLSAGAVPVVLVGGGSVLIHREIHGASEVMKPPHYEAANAVGAAIAQISGEVDRVFALDKLSRNEALDQAKQEAKDLAVKAGADRATVQVVDVEDVPLAYLPSNATRIRVKAVGDLAALQVGSGNRA